MGRQKNIPRWVAYAYDFAVDGAAVGNHSLSPIGEGSLLAGDVIKSWHGYCSSTCAGAAVTEIQRITFSSAPDEGSVTFAWGEGTATIQFDNGVDGAGLQAVLRLITGLESVTVAGSFVAGFDVTFTGVTGNAAMITVSANSLETSNVAVEITIAETIAGRALSAVTLGNAADRDGYAIDLKSVLVAGTAFNSGAQAGALLWDDTNDHPIDYLVTADNATPSMSVVDAALTAGAFKIIFEVYRP